VAGEVLRHPHQTRPASLVSSGTYDVRVGARGSQPDAVRGRGAAGVGARGERALDGSWRAVCPACSAAGAARARASSGTRRLPRSRSPQESRCWNGEPVLGSAIAMSQRSRHRHRCYGPRGRKPPRTANAPRRRRAPDDEKITTAALPAYPLWRLGSASWPRPARAGRATPARTRTRRPSRPAPRAVIRPIGGSRLRAFWTSRGPARGHDVRGHAASATFSVRLESSKAQGGRETPPAGP
jgi:hypothetical protein